VTTLKAGELEPRDDIFRDLVPAAIDYERMPSVRELMEVRHGRRLAVSLELGVDDRSGYDVNEVAGDE